MPTSKRIHSPSPRSRSLENHLSPLMMPQSSRVSKVARPCMSKSMREFTYNSTCVSDTLSDSCPFPTLTQQGTDSTKVRRGRRDLCFDDISTAFAHLPRGEYSGSRGKSKERDYVKRDVPPQVSSDPMAQSSNPSFISS